MFKKKSFSSLVDAFVRDSCFEINLISSIVFHLFPCLIPINPKVVIPLDNFLTITLVPSVKLSPSVCKQRASVVTMSLFTTLILGIVGCGKLKVKLDSGIEIFGRGTAS